MNPILAFWFAYGDPAARRVIADYLGVPHDMAASGWAVGWSG